MSMPGNQPDSEISPVVRLFEPSGWTPKFFGRISQATSEVAMAFSMIVETTSETPRVVLRMPMMPYQKAPVNIATSTITRMCSGPGSSIEAPTRAETIAASRYWPSTPMLNRFIRKPTATARAAR